MRIKQAAESTGLDADTVRFYEREGVLPPPPRHANGYRDYSEDHLATIRLVRGLRHLGLSLEEMKRIARVAHDATCGDLRDVLLDELQHVAVETDRHIQELKHAQRHVERLLDGLRRMRPRDRDVPGATPCSCVTLVGAESRD